MAFCAHTVQAYNLALFASLLQDGEKGNGMASVMKNSCTLKARDRIPHCREKDTIILFALCCLYQQPADVYGSYTTLLHKFFNLTGSLIALSLGNEWLLFQYSTQFE